MSKNAFVLYKGTSKGNQNGYLTVSLQDNLNVVLLPAGVKLLK